MLFVHDIPAPLAMSFPTTTLLPRGIPNKLAERGLRFSGRFMEYIENPLTKITPKRYTLKRVGKDDTRKRMAEAVKSAAAAGHVNEAILLDTPQFRYTRLVRELAGMKKVIVVERDPQTVTRMIQSKKRFSNGAPVHIYGGDIVETCSKIAPGGGKNCAILLDMFGLPANLGVIENMLKNALPYIVTFTDASRTHVRGNTQSRRTDRLQQMLERLGYVLELAIGYVGEPDPEHPDRRGMPMMYYQARRLLEGEQLTDTEYLPKSVRPVMQGDVMLGCWVSWHGFGRHDSTFEPPEFYYKHMNDDGLRPRPSHTDTKTKHN